jgi:thiol-disulfide isomerase/thioredoxin
MKQKYFKKNLLKIAPVLFLIAGIGCKATPLEIKTVDTQPEAPLSSMHGGNPADITWDQCGQEIGDNPCNFSLIDQEENTFSLYDNFNTVLILDFSAGWCGPCISASTHVQDFQDKYGSQGFIWVTILIENSYGEPPSQEDLASWAESAGIHSSPILAGDRSMIDLTATSGYPISAWPTIVVIDKGMVLKHGIVGWNEEIVTEWIENSL